MIGEVEGLEEYLLDGIAGAARMDDGDVVVVVEAAREVRRYAADGQLVWRSGREGEGPGELLPSRWEFKLSQTEYSFLVF